MGKIAFIFAGQGAQCTGMGQDLYYHNTYAREVFDMGERYRKWTIDQCFHGTEEIINQTENTQPILFLMDLACARALDMEGIHPDMVAGFSLGEIPALAFSKIINDEEAFQLVCERGKAMRDCSIEKTGSMVAVLRLETYVVEDICSHYENIYPVNYNCPKQIVCAGAIDELEAFCNEIESSGGKAIRLSVSGAFHTSFMENASRKINNKLRNMNISHPEIPIYSNYTAKKYGNGLEEIRNNISKQITNSVKWQSIIENMLQEGVDTFIEVGQGTVLSGLTKKICKDVNTWNVCDRNTLKVTSENILNRK